MFWRYIKRPATQEGKRSLPSFLGAYTLLGPLGARVGHKNNVVVDVYKVLHIIFITVLLRRIIHNTKD